MDDYQREAIEIADSLSDGENFIFCVATGAGKTLLFEYLAIKAKKMGKRIIYANPLKALSSEKYRTWKSNYLSHLNIMKDTSDDYENRTEENYKNYDILIPTFERINSIFRKQKQVEMIFKDVAYVVFDEIHMVDDDERGTVVEYTLMVLKDKFPHIKIIGLSATLPNYLEFAEWLNAKYVYLPADQRPVPLEHNYLEPINDYNWGGRKKSTRDLYYEKMDILKEIIREYPREQFLIFTSSRLRSRQGAIDILDLPQNYNNHLDLKDLIRKGSAYHHAGLSADDKEMVEKAFLDGKIKWLFCTPTLAAGINLPAKNAVLFDLKRFVMVHSRNEHIKQNEVKQMTGRAGRRGFDTFGRAFYLGVDDDIDFARQSIENPSPMTSKIYAKIDEHILALRVSGFVDSQQDVEEMFKKSFLHYQNPKAEFLIPKELTYLVRNNFLTQQSDGTIVATAFGNLTSKMYVSPRTANEVYHNFLDIDVEITEKEIIKAYLKTAEILLSVRVSSMDGQLLDKARRYLEDGTNPYTGMDEPIMANVYDPQYNRYVSLNLTDNYLKAIALIFHKDLNAKVYGSEGDKVSVRKNAARMISLAHIVLKTRREYRNKIRGIEYRVMVAIKMVESGKTKPQDVYLMLIDGIGEKRYERLIEKNIKSLNDFFTTPDKELSYILGLTPEKIAEMKINAKKLPLEKLLKEELTITI